MDQGTSGRAWVRGSGGGLILIMGWAYKHRDKLARRKPVRMSGASGGAGGSHANVVVLKGMDTDELVGTLTAIRHDPPPSAIEELFWWYWRVR